MIFSLKTKRTHIFIFGRDHYGNKPPLVFCGITAIAPHDSFYLLNSLDLFNNLFRSKKSWLYAVYWKHFFSCMMAKKTYSFHGEYYISMLIHSSLIDWLLTTKITRVGILHCVKNVRMHQENTVQKKLRIWTLFTQCWIKGKVFPLNWSKLKIVRNFLQL